MCIYIPQTTPVVADSGTAPMHAPQRLHDADIYPTPPKTCARRHPNARFLWRELSRILIVLYETC